MSTFLGLAEQLLANSGGAPASSDQVRKTGGQEYNSPYNNRQQQGTFDIQQVLTHASAGDENGRYISNAVQHVHDNSGQHQEQVNEGDLSTYGPVIINALSSYASKSGIDVSSLTSGALGAGGGNQLLGLVLKHAGDFVGGAGGQDKQNFLNGAALTFTKLVAQNQLSAFTGGSNSGGLGSALNIGKSLLKNRFA